jgi:hypothetical protein
MYSRPTRSRQEILGHIDSYNSKVRLRLVSYHVFHFRRMEDGYAQLLTIVKKTITDETKDSVQTIIHCLYFYIFHFKTS